MAYENGSWVMHGTSPHDPHRLTSPDELVEYVNKVGFLPLFKNEIDGFSVEEHADSRFWWCGDPETDPWEWREIAARGKKVAYGKFFEKKAGFISLEWLPYFANYRRDGYDFDSLCDEGKAQRRAEMIMKLFRNEKELFSFEIRKMAGFVIGGEKNFSGIITELMMQTYLTITDFRRRKNKKGEEYGMSVALYSPPEEVWGYELISSAYGEDPEQSRERIFSRMKELYPDASEKDIMRICK